MTKENTETGKEKPQDTAPETTKQKLVFELGITMRERREKRGKELVEVSDLLCIRRVYLEAIEQGRLDELPDGPYAVGFVRSYAKYLRMSEDKAVKMYKDYVGMIEQPADLHFPVPSQEGGLPSRVMAVAGLALLVGVYAVWTNIQGAPDEVVQQKPDPVQMANQAETQGEKQSETAQNSQQKAESAVSETVSPQTETVADTSGDTATQETTVAQNDADEKPAEPVTDEKPTETTAPETQTTNTASSENPTQTPTQSTEPVALVVSDADKQYITDLSLSSVGNVWVLIRHDGNIVMERLMTSGEQLQLAQYAGYTLDLGNAGVVTLNRNDTTSRALGQLGEVKEGLLLGSGLNMYFE